MDAIKQRIERALKQRMYLINATMIAENDWAFVVEGSTGLHYNVLINNKLSCSCKDFETRSLICKHIYFIIARVLKNSDLIKCLNDEDNRDYRHSYGHGHGHGHGPNICLFSLKLNLNEQFNEILNPRLQKKQTHIDINVTDINDVCSICYENYVLEDKVIKCIHCNNYFHDGCISIWLKSSVKCTCPLCRQLWKTSSDEFCKFVGTTL